MPRTIISKDELADMRRANQTANDGNRYSTDLRRQALKNNQDSVSQNARHDLYNDLFTDGLTIQYPHGTVMQQGQKPYYYRGQVKDYGSCQSSLYRNICGDDESTKKMKLFINQLRLYEFNELIVQLKQVQEWPFGDIFTYAIAQHYGFHTDIIDITNDLEVALFFACCKHTGNNKYRPLSESDIQGEDNKYGVLFIRNQFLDTFEASENEGKLTVYPIGFQPFTRCHKQKGFFVHAEVDDDLQSSGKFDQYFFEHSTELSNEIFHQFNQGSDLFAYDELDELQDLINAIQIAHTFSWKSFDCVYDERNDRKTKKEWLDRLRSSQGIEIGKASYHLSRQRKRAIDRKWSVQRFVNKEKITPGYRMIRKP